MAVWPVWVAFVVAGAYCCWWEYIYAQVATPTYSEPRPLPPRFVWRHWLPRFLLWVQVRDPVRRARIVKAVCLPGLWKAEAVVLSSGDAMPPEQEAHEVAGHGIQIVLMGPVDYVATYVWHYILRFGSWVNHMMEKDAAARGRRLVAHFTGQRR
jgi:hypothetical protein